MSDINEVFYISTICFLSCLVVMTRYRYDELPLIVTSVIIMIAGSSAGIMVIITSVKMTQWLK
jgi:hypothetical protein